MNVSYLDAIRGFEGFTQRAGWDYAQFSNGYGTKAKFAGEVIDKAEADQRFQAEIAQARAIVDRHAPDAPEGTKAALTSLTFNAGDKWAKSGLGEAVRSGDMERARELFLQYNKAGGEVLPGLVQRRIAEAAWIGQPGANSVAGDAASMALPSPGPVVATTSPPVAAFEAPPSTPAARQAAPFEVASSADSLPVENTPSDDATLESIKTAVSGFAGEARLTQLLLASKLIGGQSSKEPKDGAKGPGLSA